MDEAQATAAAGIARPSARPPIQPTNLAQTIFSLDGDAKHAAAGAGSKTTQRRALPVNSRSPGHRPPFSSVETVAAREQGIAPVASRDGQVRLVPVNIAKRGVRCSAASQPKVWRARLESTLSLEWGASVDLRIFGSGHQSCRLNKVSHRLPSSAQLRFALANIVTQGHVPCDRVVQHSLQ